MKKFLLLGLLLILSNNMGANADECGKKIEESDKKIAKLEARLHALEVALDVLFKDSSYETMLAELRKKDCAV